MKYDPIEQAKLIYEAQPTAYNASAYQVAMQLAALKAELEQDQKQLQAELKAAKAHLAYAERMAEQYKWQPIETAPKDGTSILVAVYEENGDYWGEDIVAWNPTNGWDSAGYDWDHSQITNWMPLPEPPEPSEEPVEDAQ